MGSVRYAEKELPRPLDHSDPNASIDHHRLVGHFVKQSSCHPDLNRVCPPLGESTLVAFEAQRDEPSYWLPRQLPTGHGHYIRAPAEGRRLERPTVRANRVRPVQPTGDAHSIIHRTGRVTPETHSSHRRRVHHPAPGPRRSRHEARDAPPRCFPRESTVARP